MLRRASAALGGFMGVALTLFVLFGVFLYYSSSPSFCRSCHNMEPYYQSWKKSRHSNIECTTCHFKPGVAGTIKGKWQATALVVQYLTHTYSPKPFAHIEDASCLQEGCHVKEKLGKTGLFMGKSAFDHKPHFREGLQSDLTCTACHSPLKSGEHISVNEMHCYLCHLKETDHTVTASEKSDEKCVECHRELPRIIPLGKRNIEHEVISDRKTSCHECHSHVVKGRGVVQEKTCFNCHAFEERVEVRGERVKLHRIHVLAHLECYLCHEEIVHRIDRKAKEAGSDCASCHLAKHSEVKTLYAGHGASGVPDRPGPMYQAGVDCIGCHETLPARAEDARGENFGAIKRRCVECHKDERYGEILLTWKKRVSSRVEEVSEKLREAEKTARGKDADPGRMKLLEEARHNLLFISGNPGVHNVGYSLNVLDAAEKNLNILLGILRPDHAPKTEKREGVIWFRDTEGLDPVRFDHFWHQSIYPECEECHDDAFDMELGSSDAMGMLTMSNMIRGKFCGKCHNGDEATSVKEKCDMCHVKEG